MKKSYKAIKMFVVLLALMTMKMSAQLNGLYTINSASPASTSNYTSFTSLASALNSLGVSGPVTVNVVANSGPYVEQITFNQFTGISATNSVLINGNGNTLTFASSNSAAPWTILMNGADYMAITNLTVTGTGSYAYALMLVGGADYNGFSGCYFGVPANGTSTSQIPVCISGSNTSYSAFANSGNYNTFLNCTMFSGYCAVSHFGYSGSPYNTDNRFISCNFTDWYVMSCYAYYAKNLTISKCNISRPTRTAITTTYGMYAYYCTGSLFEKNRLFQLFDGSPGYTGTLYGQYLYYNPIASPGVQQNNFINNIVNIDNFNGFVYGTYCYYWNGNFDHNTVNIDMPNYNYTGTVYGFYGYGTASTYPFNYRNNCLTMNLGGSGGHYAFYCPITSGFTMNNNNIINYRSIGTNSTTNNYHSYWNGAYYNQTALLAAGANVGGSMLNPNYLNPASTGINNFLPTNPAMDNLGAAIGVLQDNNSQVRGTTPDIGALEFLNTPCSGAPPLTSVQTPTAIQCPSVVLGLGFVNSYTLANMGFQWMSSTTSSVGPFTAISGATNQALTTPPTTVNTWFTASVTCLNGNQGINTTAGLVQIAGTTTNSVPYYESFEGISGVNKLPNCSWSASSLGGNCLTYNTTQLNNRFPRTGTNFASFYYNPGNVNSFYTNGIYLNAGVTYSASMWYTTEYYGYTNWTDLSILVGPNQSSVGAVVVATTGGNAVSPVYKSLSNTFTVGTSGLYYVQVRGTGNTSSSAQYLTWDDLRIEAPCALNSSSISVSSTGTAVCLGQSVTLSASGATSYTWSNGSNASSITVVPNGNTNYVVSGASALTGCVAQANLNITVNPSPIVSIFAGTGSVCKGSSINLTAFGAANYNWSGNAGTSAMVSVSPTVTTSYTVIGINSYGCTSSAVQVVNVNNAPALNVGGVNTSMCVGESMTLTVSGASTYTWTSPSIMIQGANVVVSPVNTTTYVVTGTDANGCVGTSNYVLSVNLCQGLNEITTANGVKLYPNPTKGELNIEFNNDNAKNITVTDLMGRVVMATTLGNKKNNLSLTTLANGVYYVKIESNNSTEVVKVVKQ